MKHTRTALTVLIAAALILAATPAAAAPLQWWQHTEEVTAKIPLWWVLCPCKVGECTDTAPQSTQATGTEEDTAEPAATPEPAPAPPAVSVCGQWGESGPHNCPQPASDTASPAPAPEPPQPGAHGK